MSRTSWAEPYKWPYIIHELIYTFIYNVIYLYDSLYYRINPQSSWYIAITKNARFPFEYMVHGRKKANPTHVLYLDIWRVGFHRMLGRWVIPCGRESTSNSWHSDMMQLQLWLDQQYVSYFGFGFGFFGCLGFSMFLGWMIS